MSNDSTEAETSGFLDDMLHQVTLSLSISGGRVFVHSATQRNLNSSSVELKCWWQRPGAWNPFHQRSITIGDESHKLSPADEDDETPEMDWEEQVGWRLEQCPIMLTFDEVDDAWLADSAERNGGEALKGQLSYHPPVDADEFGKSRASVSVWVPLGQDNFQLLRDRVLEGDQFEMSVGLTVQFPKGCVKSGDHGYGKSVQWDGKDALPIKDAVVVWTAHDWNSDYDHKDEGQREPEPYVPPQEHVEILAATSRIEAAVAKLVTPLWLAIAVLVWIAVGLR